jgi:HTH-type transcriptional regulator, sugar sensing transcriptional regulator
MLEEILQKFGLSDKEAKTYVAALELDTATVTEIAKKSGINRSTTYVLLDSLKKKGLMSTAGEKDNDVMLFIAASPERLLQLAEESAKRYTELVGIAQNILPELRSMHKGGKKKPRVRYFEGVEGLISAYEDTLTSTETIRAYASIENMHKSIPNYFPDYYKRRAGKDIAIRSIHPDTKEARERSKYDKEEARDSALVPKEKYTFSPEINIYDNKISFMSLVEKFALIIESVELADAFKKIFELSWQEARRLDKEIRNDDKQ